ncbi:hypothetical protein SNOG_09560 [Parastagonospora nodorum SN15]|uniref:Uncharacterized protein n=1 Tax=Phaeosphaeria nodorum (strain SN15 / ATCC MYA-4574 / FGSC 10173) TaxID=321614 RepID=Q0UFA4_PHANO|nr:hypothetical protein SNOG_09560 [Parastagonospora nodorum SN15]EAT82825.1 hypothetical protein SNOG_09560 [Parastagonospora nodorum SN15]
MPCDRPPLLRRPVSLPPASNGERQASRYGFSPGLTIDYTAELRA